jgi:hypothetical protein
MDAREDTEEHPIENGRYLAQKADLTPMTTTAGIRRSVPRFNFSVS